jgi:hypothetical protein
MASDGLTLFGFISDEDRAVQWLKDWCDHGQVLRSALKRHWLDARARLNLADRVGDAGKPTFDDDKLSGHEVHVGNVSTNPRYGDCVRGMKAVSVRMVEIDKLLALQAHVELDRAERICGSISSPPTMSELLATCLPLRLRENTISSVTLVPRTKDVLGGTIVSSADVNLDVFRGGHLGKTNLPDGTEGPDVVGVILAERAPLIQVVKYQGRHYLKNGYHRAYGLRLKGASHMPCLYLETDEVAGLEIPVNGVFTARQLADVNPPTFAHFNPDRAYRVPLKEQRRAIKVTWSYC